MMVRGVRSKPRGTAVRAGPIRHRSGWWDRGVSSFLQPISPCRSLSIVSRTPKNQRAATGITAHFLHDTYVYWVYLFDHLPPTVPRNPTLDNNIANANQVATMLGWVFVMVTTGLILLGLFDLWHRVVPGRHGYLVTSSG
jgi:hypothetical protein